jgi:23S rRNA (adenine2503-C2)-methyltransferase
MTQMPRRLSQDALLHTPTLAELVHALTLLGAKPVHVERLLRLWLADTPACSPGKAAALAYPARLAAALPDFAARLAALARIHSEHPAADGACRLLLDLAENARVECVLLPKAGLCVSTQVGCAVGCVFCATGQHGLQRQLTDAEILAQVALARARRKVTRIVFMGMGEPAHNLDAVFSALHVLGTLGGIAHKRMVLSSVGDPRLFARLMSEKTRVRPALALSLHSAHPETRARLLPRAAAFTPEALVAAGEAYARLSGHPVQYQWTVLTGINDSDMEITGAIRLLAGRYGMVNLIAHNPENGAAQSASRLDRLVDMTRQLNRAGILTRIRHSAGQEVAGGCGQLWARTA